MCKKFLLIFLYFLCLLFCSVSFAELSDEEKRAFIEGVARPFPEKRVFYRWQSETSRRTLMREKELTEESFKYFMNIKGSIGAGPGLYAAEDLHSSEMFGDTIMQIEVGTEMKYIDLTDSDTLKKLEKKGITTRDVYQLNPKAVVKYNSQHWVFKARKGLTFQAFSSKGITWNELNGLALNKPYFREAIRDDVKDRIKAKPLPINSMEEGIDILSVAGNYLKPEKKKQIARKIIPLISSVKEGSDILSIAKDYLKLEENKQVAKKMVSLMKSVREGRYILDVARDYLKLEEQKQVARKMVSLISNVEVGRDVLYVAKEVLEPEDKKQVARKMISLISNVEVGTDVFYLLRSYLEPEEKKQIMKKIARKMISRISTVREGADVFYVLRSYLEPEDKKQIARKMVSLISTVEEGKQVLSVAEDYLEPEDKKQIARKMISLIKSLWEREQVLSVAGDYLEPEDKKQIARKMVSLISTADEGRYILSVARGYLEPEEKKQIAHRILEFTGGRNVVEYVKEEGLLTDEEYKEALATFENGGQKAQHQPTLNSGTKAERLKCLKKQLQISSE